MLSITLNKKIFLLFGALAMAKASVSAQISNPASDFVSSWDHDSSDVLYKLDADINNDGHSDVFLTLTRNRNESDAKVYNWQLYIGNANGYAQAGENRNGVVDTTTPASFRIDKYAVGYIPELQTNGLLTLCLSIPSRDDTKEQKAWLKAIVIEGGGFKELPVGQHVNVSDSAAYNQLLQRFPTPLTPAIQESAP